MSSPDPILLKAIRELVEKQRALAASGVEATPEQVDEFMRVKTANRYGAADAQRILGSISTDVSGRNVGRSAMQGATFNFGDEILGALPESIGGGEGAKEDMRLREALFRRDHPVVDGAAGIAGGVASSMLVPGGGLLGEGATVGQAALRGAAIGGLAGGLSGAGAGEGGRDRLGRALVGAGTGVAIGAAVPALAAGARSSFSSALRASRRLTHAIDQSGGIDAVAAANVAAKQLGRGKEVMLGDLSDQLRSATDFAATNHDGTFIDVARKAHGRQADASERILNDVRDLAGDHHADSRVEELASSRRAWAGGPDGYQGLRDANPVVSVAPIKALLGQPRVKQIWSEAQQSGLIGKQPDISNASFSILQDTKEALDDAAQAAFRQGKGNLGTKLGEVRDAVVAHMQASVPNYQQVAAEYARRSGLETAVTRGAEAWGEADARGLAAEVARLSPEALQEMRKGLASGLIAKLRGASTNRDVAKQLVDASPAMQDKLRIVFGDEATFDQFMQRAKLEGTMAQMRGAVGGSATARRTAAAHFDPAEEMIHAAPGGVHGLVHAVTHGIAKHTTGAMARRTAGQIGPRLATQGSDEIAQLLATLRTPQPLLGPFLSQGLPGGLAGGRVKGLLGL